MNPSRAIVLAVAAGNIVLMLLFPPYDSVGFGRGGMQTFDAFYFALDRHHNKVIDADLLLLGLYWVLTNAALGWLLLRQYRPGEAIMSRRNAVILAIVANLALVLLFPPFENYASALRMGPTYFDGFYFVFGDKWQRNFYVPLLYMETLWVLINGALLWLLMRDEPLPVEAPQEE